ncbi:hypothetical protein CCMSSC00406_0004928 [Pleurotus cornucopiae]|uniref:Uncharacterized protein n=1 Tax=Pleurotus cornucopiae TaxID=5321 RepID=A0ACB7J3E7_PLECO|nr:hypothetical protein CCMSSC00406_0004928 [Pleurotus cornucopiae]
MSSLAGALIPPPQHNYLPPAQDSGDEEDDQNDVEMHPTAETEEAEQDAEMADLFGNDNDVEEVRHSEGAASPSTSAQESDRLPTPEREHRRALEYDEDDEIPAELAVEVKEANVAFPNIPVPKSSEGENWVIRMPTFVQVDSKPYHPDTYMGPEHEDEELQQTENMRERSMTIKLKVENTVRWRWIKDGNGQDRKQSNSRVIRWSDGSLSLRLGKELFDIHQSLDNSGAAPRQAFGSSQPSQSQSQSQSQSTGAKSQGLTYLVAQHKRAQVLQSEAVITGYMTLRPTGMQSETHKMLVRAVGQKHNKVARLRLVADPARDPEREVQELMKQNAKKSKRKSDYDDGLGSGRKRRYSRKRGSPSWSDDEAEMGHTYALSDDDEEEGAGGRGSGSRKGKAKEAENNEKGDYQEDGFVVADEDDDDSDGGAKRRRRDDTMEDDPLEKMEAQLEKQQEKRRQNKDNDGDDTPDEDGGAMDVESEEEEDEHKVRRVSRRKAVNIAEEEDEEE